MKATHYITFITVVFIGLFFFTGMEKVWYHRTFHIMLHKQPLANWMKAALDWGLPLVELAAVALLTITRTRLYGLWASAALMLAFAVYTAYAASEPYGEVVCACGKLFSSLRWSQHFWVNVGLAAMAATGVLLYHRISKKKTAAVG
ncbi:MauE/DoxX family redox-associated membrane protein [Parapedobacter koreensis]|uniref:Methylamine utilisation protein MauE n=1 Tax=Parapedobacter koreensis TaxID=332977 RepID=A0A1H7UB98_9SPHI|nr:MauE/DoxX family redox-associated membrane protein [Parapedobacter koreensis]SEL93577.1 Methylamine utilisation protein MauE [Parapedobacter koreensis]